MARSSLLYSLAASLPLVLGLATETPAQSTCTGDCDGSGFVEVNELVVGLQIGLGSLTTDQCEAADADGDSRVLIDEMVLAVTHALTRCPELPTPTSSPTSTPPTPTPPVQSNGLIEVRIFSSENGTTYYAIGSTVLSGSVGLGIQVTSVALSSSEAQGFRESGTPIDPVRTVFAGAVIGAIPTLDHIYRTHVLSGFPTGGTGELTFAPAANEGNGLLFLPGGNRAVTRTGLEGGGTEPIFPVSEESEGAGRIVPPAALSRIVRRLGTTQIVRESLVFPNPGPARCATGSANAGAQCTSDVDCGFGCPAVGACCGASSLPPTCGDGFTVCDPADPILCTAVGGACSNLGGETEGQNITLDDTIGSRMGNEESQGDVTDGFLLAAGKEWLVFVVDPDADPPALQAAAGGFIVTGLCTGGPMSGRPCSVGADCPGSRCAADVSGREVRGTAIGTAIGSGPPSQSEGILSFIQRFPPASLCPLTAVAIDPDGNNLYVTGGDALRVLRRNRSTGSLDVVEVEINGQNGVHGLAGAFAVNTTADGNHVYVAGSDDDSVAVFQRDPDTGALEFVESQTNGVNGVEGLDVPVFVAPSGDGRNVYVASIRANAVVAFARDTSTGELSFIDIERDGVGGVDGIGGAYTLALSPDDHYVYATGFNDSTVVVFERTTASGALVFRGGRRDSDDLNRALSVAVSPDGTAVYASASAADTIVEFERQPSNGLINILNVFRDGVGGVDGLDDVGTIALDPTGEHLYAAAYVDDAVTLFRRSPTTRRLTFANFYRDGENDVSGLQGAIGVVVSPDGNNVYVAAEVSNAVGVFDRSGTTGELAFVEEYQSGAELGEGLRGGFSLAVSPDGKHIYTVGQSDRAVAAFRRDPVVGTVAPIEVQRGNPEGSPILSRPASVTLSPDGSNVYVATFGSNEIITYSRNAATGSLTFVEAQQDGVDGVDALDGATQAAVSPNGLHVYVTGSRDDAVTVFERDLASGKLTFVQALRNGVDGIEGLTGADPVTISPDGAHVYVGSFNDDAIVVLTRDTATGMLTPVQVIRDGQDGVDGLLGVAAIVLSPDGLHAYTAGYSEDAVGAFERDPESGALSFVQVLRDGVAGIRGLASVQSLAMSSDGARVYAASTGDNSLSVFERDLDNGRLKPLELEQDRVGGVDGLDGALAVRVSPDDAHVYVVASSDNAITAFRINRR